MTDETIERGSFVDRVNAEAEKAREALYELGESIESLGLNAKCADALAECAQAFHHLENARLRILHFARQPEGE